MNRLQENNQDLDEISDVNAAFSTGHEKSKAKHDK